MPVSYIQHSGIDGRSSTRRRPLSVCGLGYRALLGFAVLLLIGCGTQTYRGASVDSAAFLQRSVVQETGPLRVTTAVPDAEETKALTGLDLYAQGIQPIWLQVENNGATRARISLWSVDRDYFSPIEVAYMNRKRFSSDGYASLERWFYDNRLERFVPPGEKRSGLVFTNLRPGTKGFNLDIFSNRISHSFTFFVPLPGFTADYMEVDFANLYRDAEIKRLDGAGLKMLLEQDFPCCTEGPNGEKNGAPLNVVLVGTPLAVRRSLLRGGWLETETGSDEMQRARNNRFHDRAPDAIFRQSRKDGDERMGLMLWLAPWTVDGDPVWVGSVIYTVLEQSLLTELASAEIIRDSAFLSSFVNESVSADIDSAQRFLLQNFWYSQSLRAVGIVKGAGGSTLENPAIHFNGVAYFTEGNRNVMFLSETPTALDDIHVLYGREYLRAGGPTQ